MYNFFKKKQKKRKRFGVGSDTCRWRRRWARSRESRNNSRNLCRKVDRSAWCSSSCCTDGRYRVWCDHFFHRQPKELVTNELWPMMLKSCLDRLLSRLSLGHDDQTIHHHHHHYQSTEFRWRWPTGSDGHLWPRIGSCPSTAGTSPKRLDKPN